MLNLVLSVALMFAVVGGSFHWALRKQRRQELPEEGHARHR